MWRQLMDGWTCVSVSVCVSVCVYGWAAETIYNGVDRQVGVQRDVQLAVLTRLVRVMSKERRLVSGMAGWLAGLFSLSALALVVCCAVGTRAHDV